MSQTYNEDGVDEDALVEDEELETSYHGNPNLKSVGQ